MSDLTRQLEHYRRDPLYRFTEGEARELADLVFARDEENHALREALQKLYDYTCALEAATAAQFAVRSYMKRPEGGQEAGELARAALAVSRPAHTDG